MSAALSCAAVCPWADAEGRRSRSVRTARRDAETRFGAFPVTRSPSHGASTVQSPPDGRLFRLGRSVDPGSQHRHGFAGGPVTRGRSDSARALKMARAHKPRRRSSEDTIVRRVGADGRQGEGNAAAWLEGDEIGSLRRREAEPQDRYNNKPNVDQLAVEVTESTAAFTSRARLANVFSAIDL